MAWGEAGSAENGKKRKKFLFELQEEGSLEPGKVRSIKRLKQKLIVPLTETEVMVRQLLVELARKVEEENVFVCLFIYFTIQFIPNYHTPPTPINK